jgi:hypothetical protein
METAAAPVEEYWKAPWAWKYLEPSALDVGRVMVKRIGK